ncbi:MAG TPA: YkvA family protein [Candidatus Limnocylindria bacterium]|nr:YkvA family protein [Candidatus Limnocylindria bacterium]
MDRPPVQGTQEETVITNRRRAAFAAAAAAAASNEPLTLGARIAAFPNLVADVLLGRWDGLTRGRLMMMGLALLYIVSPIDLMPEALLTIPGLLDDAAVAAWLVAALFGSTAAYDAWRRQASAGPQVVPGDIVRG